MNTQEILEKQRKYLWPNHILYYTEPLPLDHGDGTYVWDVEGGATWTSSAASSPRASGTTTHVWWMPCVTRSGS